MSVGYLLVSLILLLGPLTVRISSHAALATYRRGSSSTDPPHFASARPYDSREFPILYGCLSALVFVQFRMEHSVAMQNRGLLRHPFAIPPSPSPPHPTPPSPHGAPLAGEGGKGTGTPTTANASETAATTPAAAATTAEEHDAGGDYHGFGDYVSAAAESDEESDPYEQEEPAAALAAGVFGAQRKPASPTSPRLEEWPGFPSPSVAFARAAPVENPKGVLPPSPQVLRFIHQVNAAVKSEKSYGTGTEKT